MSRLDQVLYQSVLKRAKFYSDLWDQKTALSAGIAALDLLDAQQREEALAIAKGRKTSEASTKYVLMTDDDSKAFREFQKIRQSLEPEAVVGAAEAAAQGDKRSRRPRKSKSG